MKKRPNPTFRPATADDIKEFFPDNEYNAHAWVVEIPGEVLGIGGIFYTKESVVAFSDNKPELEKYPFTMARCAKKIMEIIGDRQVIAMVGPKYPGSHKLLGDLGFEHIEGNVYRYG